MGILMKKKVDKKVKNKVNKNKVIQRVLITITALSFLILLIFSPLWYYAFNRQFYQEEFETFGIENRFEHPDEVFPAFESVLAYVNGKEDFITYEQYYNKQEREHLSDVRGLFKVVKICISLALLLLGGISIYCLTTKKWNLFITGMWKGSLFTLGFITILTLSAIINFEGTFNAFHKITFSNDLWMLDPMTDNLLKMLPQEIFFNLSLKLFFMIMILSIITFSIGILLLQKIKAYKIK
jgi:integral membrane protein (TIGR01906 family)